MKIPNWIVRISTSIRLFQRIISGRNSQPPRVARTLLSPSCETCPRHQHNQNLGVSYAQLGTPLLPKARSSEARSHEVIIP